MDVKGAKALSERLAEAARNVDPPPAKAVGSEDTDRGSEVAEHCGEGATAPLGLPDRVVPGALGDARACPSALAPTPTSDHARSQSRRQPGHAEVVDSRSLGQAHAREGDEA